MSISIVNVIDFAMSMPVDERERLAEKLYRSLDGVNNEDVSGEWISEAQRRVDEVVSGKVEPIDRDVAMDRIRNSLRK